MTIKLITFYLFNFHRETKTNCIMSSRRLHGKQKLVQQLHGFIVMMMKKIGLSTDDIDDILVGLGDDSLITAEKSFSQSSKRKRVDDENSAEKNQK